MPKRQQRIMARVHFLDEVHRAEVQHYAQNLRPAARTSFKIDHYEQTPQNTEQRVIDTAKQAKEEATT